MDSLKQKTYKALAWDLIGRFGNQGIGFIISIFLARLLTPSDFGLLAIVTVIIGMSTILQDFGLGMGIIQRQNVREEHYGSVFFFNVFIGFLLCISLFFSSGLIAEFYNSPQLKPLCQVMSLIFIINSFCNVQRMYLRKNLIFEISVKANLFAMTIGGVIGILMAFRGYGVWSLVFQQLIGSVINNVYVYFAVKWKPKIIFEWNALKELWKFGINMFLSGVLENIFRNLDSLIIGKLFSSQVLGYYYRASSLNNLVTNYSSASLMSVLFPVLSKVQNDKEQYLRIVYNAFHILNFLTLGILGLLYITANDIIVILFSAKWLPAVHYYKILVLGGFIYPFSALLVNILSSKGNSKGFLRLEIYKKIFIGLNFLIGFWFGLEGFLYGMVIAYIIALVLNIFFAAKELEIAQSWFYKMMYPYFIVVILITASLSLIDNIFHVNSNYIHFLIYFITYLAFYLLISLLFKLKGLSFITNEIKKLNLGIRFQKIFLKK